uniref:MIT domain-containing protein n=1 Tax=Chromera velia CCMP2878 TaxID=1169474 RepID=A0A0G4HMT9_9ALVE|mmetsp:Transcript_13660/g.27152  ORF Transcript_13660/g.27152 Transcript_13660/m.27152 type:complete len:272 (-) Transcript_13660:864-1679(-)|eukprot:Cvel_29414.t1-p1 / transcript=Cvel_29414.t1 / gene=Cvel_29414 / organism=Chromera_velia_CCMP2878 / gene_product=hypothetical protein / transcript_product=hypothetical protein / location=Cvel_scaffold4015:3747-6898(+) / protein_length=271 / sequence_SO=supercontig / SO=protein_coding / is_pseudo=false
MLYPDVHAPSADPVEQALHDVDRITQEAMQQDRAGRSNEAIAGYMSAASRLRDVISGLNPSSPQAAALETHKRQLEERAERLRQLSPAQVVEEHEAFERQTQEQNAVGSTTGGASSLGGARVAGAAGIMGATAGALILGPLGLIAGGAAALYASTRSDTAGDITRQAGQAGVTAAERAADFEREHHLIDKAKHAATTTWESAKRVNEEYQITQKVSSAATWSWEKAKETNEKYHISENVGRAASNAWASLSSFMRRSSAPAAPGGSAAPPQ